MKKKATKSVRNRRPDKRKTARVTELLIHGGSELDKRNSRERLPPLAGQVIGSNGTKYEYQIIRNPYVPGKREKMLEKRAKLTLKAFRIAYENNHRS